MSAWVAVAIALCLAGVFLWGWLSERNKSTVSRPSPGELKIVADFDAKKKAEAERIDGESHEDLLKDLNGRSGGS